MIDLRRNGHFVYSAVFTRVCAAGCRGCSLLAGGHVHHGRGVVGIAPLVVPVFHKTGSGGTFVVQTPRARRNRLLHWGYVRCVVASAAVRLARLDRNAVLVG